MNSLIFKRVELVARRMPGPVRPLLYVVGGVWWLLGPILVFGVLMALASLATWGVAWLVYDNKGRPQNWEVRADRALAAQVANVLQPQRTNRVYFMGVPMELPEARFRQTIERNNWKSAGPGALVLNEKVVMVYGMDGDGVVTRAQVTVDGIDVQQMIGLLGRCMGTWGNPLAAAGPIGPTGRVFEAISWRDDRAMVVFDLVPMRGRGPETFRLHLSVYSVRDPMYDARGETFGFPPGHRLLEEVKKDAADREAGIVTGPVPAPMGIGPGGARVVISPQRGRIEE